MAKASSPTMLFPDSRFRSPTAIQDKAEVKDFNIYSACVLANAGSGQVKMFTVPQGQAILSLPSSIASLPSYQTTHDDHSTNLSEAARLGSGIGNAQVRGIGLTIEQARITPATGAATTTGSTQYEVANILASTSFEFRVDRKPEINGPVWNFPGYGGAYAAISTTGNAATASAASNGVPQSAGRRLKAPILIDRTDNLEAILKTGNGYALQFSTSVAPAQASLVWCSLLSMLLQDVR